MPRPADPARTEAIKAIRDHMRHHGPVEGPRRARLNFADVPSPTWHRWVRMTRDEDKDLIAEAAEIVPRLDQPAPPLTEPDRISVRRAIDFYRELDAMVADAELLANHAVARNEDGTRRVKNPQLLATAHRMRATNLALAMKYSEMVWSVERIEQMHEALALAVMQADRDTGKRVLAAMKDIQNRWNPERNV